MLLGLRAAPKEDSGVSSAELVQGTPLILPGQLGNVPEPPRVDVAPPPTRPASYADAANTPPTHLAVAHWVYVRRGGQLRPLQDPYAGPFLVEKKGAKYFVLKIGQRSETVSVDRLKAHSGTAPVSPAMPAPRGRPIKQAAA